MSTMIYDEEMHEKETLRPRAIQAMRSALNGLEQGEDDVSLSINGIELNLNFTDGEIYIIV